MTRMLASSRVLRTGNPLTLEGIRQACPAVFAERPAPGVSERYQYVPTIEPLKALLNNGWGVYEASQQRSRKSDRDPYTKHMLRLRRLTDFNVQNFSTAEGVPELIVVNAHDRTAYYKLFGGFFRFVCSNGAIVGNHIASFSVKHLVGPSTSEEVLTAAQRVVTESFPAMLADIDKFQSVILIS